MGTSSRAFIALFVIAAFSSIEGMAGTTASPKNRAKSALVILMLDPDGNMLRNGRLDPANLTGPIAPGGHTNHKSSVIIYTDGATGETLGLAEIPGLAREYLDIRRASDGLDEVLGITEGDFKRHHDIADATMESLFMGPMQKTTEWCGATRCDRNPDGSISTCYCLEMCLNCIHIIVNP